MQMMSKTKFGFLLCLVILLGASAFLLYHLGTEPLQDYDEATYAEVVHEAFLNGHYLSYTEGGVPFLEKPPLGFWAMEASEAMLGENAFAQRLPFALFGIATIAALMLLVYAVSKSIWAAALGGAVLATMPPFMEAAREVRLDVPLLFFITLAVYFFIRALQNPKWLVLFGVAVGLAFMTKSVIAVFALVAAALVLALHRRFDLCTNKYLYYGAALGLVVVVPWHVWEWVQFGDLFWDRYVTFNLLQRAQENLFWTVQLTNADYIWYLQKFTEPWFAVFFAALAVLAVGWKWLPQNSRRFAAASVGAIIAVISVFFIAKTKAPTYLLPIYPFAAANIALVAASVRTRLWQVAAAVVCVLLLLSGAGATYRYAYHLDPYFSVVVAEAHDEHAIANILKSLPNIEPVYVYGSVNLGSIYYYSQHFELLQLVATSSPAGGALLIADTGAISQFAKEFPDISTSLVYAGQQITLFQILRED